MRYLTLLTTALILSSCGTSSKKEEQQKDETEKESRFVKAEKTNEHVYEVDPTGTLKSYYQGNSGDLFTLPADVAYGWKEKNIKLFNDLYDYRDGAFAEHYLFDNDLIGFTQGKMIKKSKMHSRFEDCKFTYVTPGNDTVSKLFTIKCKWIVPKQGDPVWYIREVSKLEDIVKEP